MVDNDHNDYINHLSIEELDRKFGNPETREISRRELITKGAKIAGGIAAASYLISDALNASADVKWADEKEKPKTEEAQNDQKGVKQSGKARIVQVQDTKSVDSSGEGRDGPVNNMVMKGIIQLTGETDKARAWRKIARNGQRVGIKVNCIAGRGLSTQVPVVMAIVDGLKLAGVLERDILIWDRSDGELNRAGYTIQKGVGSLRCYGTPGYESQMNDINGTKFKLSKILTEEIDVLINVPIMKDHGSSGVTLSMKNHYGSHNNPGDHHGNNCDPHIANINSHQVIRQKTKLIVVDALRAQCNGGPSDKARWKWNPGIILMGFDPVAIDRIGGDIIDQRRAETGVNPLGNSHSHIVTASKLGLGVEDRKMIDIQKIVIN